MPAAATAPDVGATWAPTPARSSDCSARCGDRSCRRLAEVAEGEFLDADLTRPTGRRERLIDRSDADQLMGLSAGSAGVDDIPVSPTDPTSGPGHQPMAREQA